MMPYGMGMMNPGFVPMVPGMYYGMPQMGPMNYMNAGMMPISNSDPNLPPLI